MKKAPPPAPKKRTILRKGSSSVRIYYTPNNGADQYTLTYYRWNDVDSALRVGARTLAQCKGDLHLGSLMSLSDAAAQALGQHKGDLDLDGLKKLSAGAAEALAQCKGDLDLWRLNNLSRYGASQLVKLPSLTLCRSRQSAGAQKVFKEAGIWEDTFWRRNT